MGDGAFVSAINNRICVTESDYNKYGCTRCGNRGGYWNMQGPGFAMGSCASCEQWLSIVADGTTVAPFKLGDSEVPVVPHPLAPLATTAPTPAPDAARGRG